MLIVYTFYCATSEFIFSLLIRCKVCLLCIQSSVIAPPVGLCRLCCQYNEEILVPPNYHVGHVSTPGVEVMEHSVVMYHINARGLARRTEITKVAHPTQNLTVQRPALPFDMNSLASVSAWQKAHPNLELLEPNTATSRLQPSNLNFWARKIFHCGHKMVLDLAMPILDEKLEDDVKTGPKAAAPVPHPAPVAPPVLPGAQALPASTSTGRARKVSKSRKAGSMGRK